MKAVFLILSLAVVFFSCSLNERGSRNKADIYREGEKVGEIDLGFLGEVDKSIAAALKGKWVKQSRSRDTIQIDGKTTLLELRCQEEGGSCLRPGIYQFGVRKDSIQVLWVAQSTILRAPGYHFRISEDRKTLYLGNFYKAEGEGGVLTFSKL
jgi:hypothetical protein